MPSRFGEKITDQDAYDTARGAASHMSDEQLAATQAQGSNQQQALDDERAARSGG